MQHAALRVSPPVALAVDIFAFAWVIYMTGGDQSWLLLLLLIRVADQANTNFRRAIAFGFRFTSSILVFFASIFVSIF